MDSRAQSEIRAYAVVIGEQIVARWVPLVWEAFLDYWQQAVFLTRIDVAVIEALMADDKQRAIKIAATEGFLRVNKSGELMSNRERKELEAKLRQFGFDAPWNGLALPPE
jgi:thymidylate synthase (FAD)